MSLTFLDLFAGIGGISLGLERAGLRCVGQVEIDPFCRAVLAKHWPDVPRWEDVRTFTKGCLHERPDLICGGFPCQDISNAGRRVGIDGEHSGLWTEFHRIVCELRPRFVFVENVAALTVRGLDRVCGDLAASGYDAEWDCIPAAAVGAPHIRDRIWIVAYPSLGRFSGVRGARRFAGQPDGMDSHVPDAEREGLERPRLRWATPDRIEWLPEPDVCRVAHGIPDQVDRLRVLGNACVPQVVEHVGRLIIAAAEVAHA
jgi:DNA (cytosine-5)-methyltransferase 1